MRRALGRTGTIRVIAGLAAVSLVLTACGSDSDSGSTTSAATSAAATSAAATSEASSEPSSEAPSSDASSEASSSEASSSEDTGSSAATSSAATMANPADAKVGLAYDLGGRGDQSFNDSAAKGLDAAKEQGAEVVGELEATANEPDTAKVDRLEQLIADGANTVIGVGFAYAGPVNEVAPKHEDVAFAVIDDASNCTAEADGGLAGAPLANVACLTFAEEQGSYLVGAVAALKSESGKVGFIGGVNVPLIQKFQAGYEAGVAATKDERHRRHQVHHRAAGLHRLQ